jgi:hypothetical protein
MTATLSMESASGSNATAGDRLKRGRRTVGAFLMQGWGQFLNQSVFRAFVYMWANSKAEAFSLFSYSFSTNMVASRIQKEPLKVRSTESTEPTTTHPHVCGSHIPRFFCCSGHRDPLAALLSYLEVENGRQGVAPGQEQTRR